jgi:hypothetical protein
MTKLPTLPPRPKPATAPGDTKGRPPSPPKPSPAGLVTPKHLGRYADEFAFRLNEGNVKRHTLDRLESFATATAGKRLTYRNLIQ